MKCVPLFFENVTGFFSTIYYTRKVNGPSRTNRGLENALFIDEDRFICRKHETERFVHGRGAALRPQALLGRHRPQRRLWRSETKRRNAGDIRRNDMVT